MLLVASIWYLLFTSILMVGQYFLERRFSRGVGDRRPERKTPMLTGAIPIVGTTQATVISAATEQSPTARPGQERD